MTAGVISRWAIGLAGIAAFAGASCEGTAPAPGESVAQTPVPNEQVVAEFEGFVDTANGRITIGPAQRATQQALMTEVPVVSDGVPDSGPVNTVELVTESTPQAPQTVPGGCGAADSFEGYITVRSFYTEMLRNVHTELLTVTPTGHEGCNSVAPPDTGVSRAYGLWSYGDLAGNGGAATRLWKLKSPGSENFRFTGRVIADRSPAYSRTIDIGGTLSFNNTDEEFGTSSSGYYGYVSWDASYLYLGMRGPDVTGGGNTKFVLVYVSGAGQNGTTIGQKYNTQEPQLPFPAEYHVRFRSDLGYTNAMRWNGSNWADAGWNFTDDVWGGSGWVEMRIPWSDIGNPQGKVRVHMNMINEAGGSEWTYAGVPSNSFTDGYHPKYTRYYEFDRTYSTVPNKYPVRASTNGYGCQAGSDCVSGKCSDTICVP